MPVNPAGWPLARKVLTAAYGRAVDAGFVHEVIEATGGEAPLVRALAEDLAAAGVVPESGFRDAVATMAGPRLARMTGQLAARIDPELLPVVLLLCAGGGMVPYAWLSRLFDVSRITLDRGARLLAELGILDGGSVIRFRHAPTRRLLAAHVTQRLTEPARWTVVQTQLLHLFEGPPHSPPRMPDELVLARLLAAVRRRMDVPTRLLLAEQLCWAGQGGAALRLLRDPLPAGTDAAAAHRMRTLVRCHFPGELGVAPAPPAGTWAAMNDTPPLTVAVEALAAVQNGMPAYEVAPRAQSALAALELGPGTFYGIISAVWALQQAGRLEDAEAWTRKLAQSARRQGGAAWQSMFLTVQATLEWQLGRLKAAHRHNTVALELAAEKFPTAPFRVVIEWSRLTAMLVNASDVLERIAVEPPPTSAIWVYHRFARGCERLAQGRPDEAYADFTTCGAVLHRWRMDIPTIVPWRSRAALALAATDRPAALVLALEEVRLARACAAPRVLGISLRGAAALADPPFRLDLLRESALVHENVGARLEQAATLCEIGLEQLRGVDRQEGLATLRAALRLAEECSDGDLGTRIHGYLDGAGEAAGRAGMIELTASQRRVALLAMQGRSNRGIAQELFLTVSTVEQHLTQIYRKLGVSRRAELTRLTPEALLPGVRGRDPDLRVAPSQASAEE